MSVFKNRIWIFCAEMRFACVYVLLLWIVAIIMRIVRAQPNQEKELARNTTYTPAKRRNYLRISILFSCEKNCENIVSLQIRFPLLAYVMAWKIAKNGWLRLGQTNSCSCNASTNLLLRRSFLETNFTYSFLSRIFFNLEKIDHFFEILDKKNKFVRFPWSGSITRAWQIIFLRLCRRFPENIFCVAYCRIWNRCQSNLDCYLKPKTLTLDLNSWRESF